MSWQGTWTFNLAFGLDLFAAAIVFGQFGLSVSTMAGLVRDGRAAPLKLRLWQEDFLRWLEPRLSAAHCADALIFDRQRAKTVLQLLGDTP